LARVVFIPSGRVGLPLHVGSLCLALLWVSRLKRYSRRTRRLEIVVGVALAAFTAAGATDQLVLLYGVVPFVVAPAICWWQGGSATEQRVSAFAFAVGIGSVIGAEALAKLMEHDGIRASLGAGSFEFIPIDQIGSSLAAVVGAWMALGNGDFFGAPINRAGVETFGLGCLMLVALGVTAHVLWRTAGVWWRERTARSERVGQQQQQDVARLFVVYWGVVLAITFASNVFTSVGPTDPPGYLLAGWAGVGALLGSLASSREARALVTSAVAVFALGIAGQNIKDGMPPPATTYSPAQIAGITHFVERHDASVGYAGYWESNNFTWATGFKVKVFPIWNCPRRPGELCRRVFTAIGSWYTPRGPVHTFLITGTAPLSIAAPATTFGAPLASAIFGPYMVRVYGHDIAAQLPNYY
jgi:hypothetical protein